ncbi:hypothetical protein N665_1138s0004 [Sinapis alba]|nr:hypothetical protein N665_1138s0004 [Sinapis alba]
MAISHAQPLLLLFVYLFFLPAALGTAIEFSNGQHHIYDGVVTVTKVEIIPYPIKFHDNPIFKITAVSSQSLVEKWLTMTFTSLGGISSGDGNIGITNKKFYLCDVTKCPIEPGRPFVITLANVYAVQRNDHLSGENKVSLFINDIEGKPSLFHMYAEFKFHASALARFTNFPRLNGVTVSKVEIFPFNVTVNDNPVFRITADTPKNITSSTTVSATMVYEGKSELLPRPLIAKSSRTGYKICDSSYHCPITPGGLVLTFPHPYWRYKIEAGRYSVQVQIINQNFPFQESMNLLFWFWVSEA